MSGEHSREELLKSIKTAETEGAQREEQAKTRAAGILTETQTECARIIEGADKEGRTAMRKSVETAKAECAATREKQLDMAAARDGETEVKSRTRMPAVAEFIFREFKKELDVKD